MKIDARIGGNGVSSPRLVATAAADRVAMIGRYLAEHPDRTIVFLEVKRDDPRSWAEWKDDLDLIEYMQVGIVGDYAAAQYSRGGFSCADPIVHATYNPHPRPEAPRIPYDPELSWYFPAENVVSRAEVHQLMVDFVLTGDWSHTSLWRSQQHLVAAGR
jgi:hypothetical protein